MPPLIFIAEKTFTIDKKVNIPSLGIVLNVLVHNHYLAFFSFQSTWSGTKENAR